MIKPSIWREFFKPVYSRMFAEVRKAGKHIFFHSDRYIVDIIPDFIEPGVDALSEAELQVNGIDEFGDKFGGRICFWGTWTRRTYSPLGAWRTLRIT